MSDAWLTVAALAVTTFAIKGSGPLALGGRELPPRAMNVIAFLAPALLSALIVVQTFSDGRSLTLDARAVGIAVAALSLSLRRSALLAVVLAAASTALARAIA